MTLCKCGCRQEVKPGNRYINGHNGRGRKHSEGTKRKMSEAAKGFKNSRFQHGRGFILGQHHKYRKQKCIFGCESAKRYNLHHEPPLEKDILEWEGRLINLCHSCHRKTHHNTLKLPDSAGVEWTKKDTKKALEEVDND